MAARVTEPVNPPASVTIMVSVTVSFCVTDRLDAEAVRAKPGLLVTVNAMVVAAVSVPELPVIVIVADPTAAVELAVRVNTLVLVAGLVPNDAVTPVGIPDAARVTEPANRLTSVTVMVSVLLAP